MQRSYDPLAAPGIPPPTASTPAVPLSGLGYGHPGYARSLREFGIPTELPASGGFFLRRKIPGTAWFDGLGLYPYLACSNWSALPADLDALNRDLVTFAATPDPFGAYRTEDLARAFPDHLIRFKDHFVADLSVPLEKIVSRNHLKLAQKALRVVDVEFSTEPLRHLDVWSALFDEAVRRFDIRGIRAFSRQAFHDQLSLPGTVMSLARSEGETVAAHVQIQGGPVVYAHLAAALPKARSLGASYALYLSEIEYYAGKARWLDWGGGAGVEGQDSGLTRFKRGWSTETRPAYFGGRVLDLERYRRLNERLEQDAGSYFPAYRAGEFG